MATIMKCIMEHTCAKLHLTLNVILMLMSSVLICAGKNSDNVHTSTYLLRRLLKDELGFVKNLNNYVSFVENHSKQVRDYVNTVYSNFYPGDNTEGYVSNPLNSLGIVKRTGYDYIKSLKSLINSNPLIRLREKMLDILSTRFPAGNDYHETFISIALLQDVYDLNITDFMNGEVKMLDQEAHEVTFKSNFNLTCIQMHQIGAAASTHGWYDSGYAWLKMAIDKCLGRNNSGFDMLKSSYKKNMANHDYQLDKRRGTKDYKENFRTFTLPFNATLRKKKRYKNILQSLKSNGKQNLTQNKRIKQYIPLFHYNNTKAMSNKMKQRVLHNFHSLCKHGQAKWRTPEMNLNITCRYQHLQNPYLKIGPFLLEEKNIEPLVVVFHNFMTPQETRYFKDSVGRSMRRSKTMKAGESKVTDGLNSIRTSQQEWIVERMYKFPVTDTYKGWDYNGTFHFEAANNDIRTPIYPSNVQDCLIVNNKIAYGITKRIEMATKLVLDRPYASESYQVANYGIGGQYSIHVDPMGYHAYPKDTPSISKDWKHWYSLGGDRHATFMVYLSAVEFGGGTAFPLLGLSKGAVTGDAVFWNNVWSEGGIDYLSFHGGCPVVVGSKWITNKWIQYYDNFHGSPCELEEFQATKTFHRWRKISI